MLSIVQQITTQEERLKLNCPSWVEPRGLVRHKHVSVMMLL